MEKAINSQLLLLNVCAKKILKHTPQLYHKKPQEIDNFKAQPYASSILVSVLNQKYLITASHVIDEGYNNNTGILIGRKFFPLIGDVRYVDRDSFDIAVVRLSENLASDICKLDLSEDGEKFFYEFLPWERVDVNHNANGSIYSVVGYPYLDTEENELKKTYYPYPLHVISLSADKDAYELSRRNKDECLILEYEQENAKNFITNEYERKNSPRGVSGCGVWHVANMSSGTVYVDNYKLVAQVV